MRAGFKHPGTVDTWVFVTRAMVSQSKAFVKQKRWTCHGSLLHISLDLWYDYHGCPQSSHTPWSHAGQEQEKNLEERSSKR